MVSKLIHQKRLAGPAVALLALVTALGCERSETKTIRVDGSSTVFPITEAVAEEFQKTNPGVRVTVGISGTGGGFKKFCTGETDISDASRPIKPTEEELAQKNGVDYIELPVAFDGLSVVVNSASDFVDALSVEELKRIWQPDSGVKRWSDVRAGWPERELHLYGPGTDSGTFDYFTEAIVGKERACRPDFTASEDDNVLVQGIAGDRDALGYLGYAYFVENKQRLKLIPVDSGSGPVAPSEETIRSGTYRPLSRPVFIYVNTGSAKRLEVQEFVRYYLTHAAALVKQVGYIPLPERVYELALERFKQRKTGSAFAGAASRVGLGLEELLQAEQK